MKTARARSEEASEVVAASARYFEGVERLVKKKFITRPYGVWLGAEVVYVGMHRNEEDVWENWLGWPTPVEIDAKKRQGYRVSLITVKEST